VKTGGGVWMGIPRALGARSYVEMGAAWYTQRKRPRMGCTPAAGSSGEGVKTRGSWAGDAGVGSHVHPTRGFCVGFCRYGQRTFRWRSAPLAQPPLTRQPSSSQYRLPFTQLSAQPMR
jgi:hypothetical protein